MYKEGTGRVRIQINKYDGLRVRHHNVHAEKSPTNSTV